MHTLPPFDRWLDTCDDDLHDTVAAHVLLLEAMGRTLGRPVVDPVPSRVVAHLKALRFRYRGRPYRILFAIDPGDQAVLISGCELRELDRGARQEVHRAEAVYEQHLHDLEYQHD